MKAQIWSFDYVASIIIFITSLALIMFFWSYANTQSFEHINLAELQDSSISVSEILLRSKGIPENWTADTVNVIGLVQDEKILDPSKVYKFKNLDYDKSRILMGIGKYNYYFKILHMNDTQVIVNGTDAIVGVLPTNTASVSPIERYVLLNGEIVKVKIFLWSPQ